MVSNLDMNIMNVPGYKLGRINKAWFANRGWVVIYKHEYNIQDLLLKLKNEGAEKIEMSYVPETDNREFEKEFILDSLFIS